MVEVSGKKATRYGFGEALVELGEKNSKIFVIGADTASSVVINLFQEKFPNRFANVGVAELASISNWLYLPQKQALTSR